MNPAEGTTTAEVGLDPELYPVMAGGAFGTAVVLGLLAFFLLRGRNASPQLPPAPPDPPALPAPAVEPLAPIREPQKISPLANSRPPTPLVLPDDGDPPETLPGAMPRLSMPPGRMSMPPGALRGEHVHDVAPVSRQSATPEPAGNDLFSRLRRALGRSRDVLRSKLDALFRSAVVAEGDVDELEEALLRADVGPVTADRLISRLKTMIRAGENTSDQLRAGLRREMLALLPPAALNATAERPWVCLVVGVNGSGKTTTVGKLAARFRKEGKLVVIAAADTYRAAASDQLQVWATRAGAELVSHQPGADPAAVVFDAMAAAKARNADVVLIDTAGRLQTAKPLMDQLSKIRRIVDRAQPGAPHETLLVLDGTMGQNALSQARLFNEATPLTGVAVTKLDGTAKGGVVLAIATELGLPVKLIGIGERVEDLRDFEPEPFVDALL